VRLSETGILDSTLLHPFPSRAFAYAFAHYFSGPIVRYFILPLGVERLAVADNEALKDINLRYPYRFVKPQRAINWMKPVLGEKGILLVSW
jgi:hypothetical protein